jgi:hypothetical protein
MRTAPPVCVAVASGGGWRVALAGLVALCVGACTAWLLAHLQFPDALLAGALATALAGVCAWRLLPSAQGRLAWDGSQWSFGTASGPLRVMVDLGAWMLLRLDASAPKAGVWVAVGAARAGPSWHALRAAVYSRGPNKSDE